MAHADDYEVTDYIFKVLLLGDKGVGKSSIARRYTEGRFGTWPTTLFVEYGAVTRQIRGKWVKMQVWDTAGEEKYHSLTDMYYRNVHGVVFVFDLTNPSSLSSVEDTWIKQVYNKCPDGVCCALVGSKSDAAPDLVPSFSFLDLPSSSPDGRDLSLASDPSFTSPTSLTNPSVALTTSKSGINLVRRKETGEEREEQVNVDEISRICDLYCMSYFSTSAKTGSNVDQVFDHLSERMMADRCDLDELPCPDSLPSFALHSFLAHSPVPPESAQDQANCYSCTY